MKSRETHLPTRGVARRLIILTIFFSTIITLVISVIQLYGEYRENLSEIDKTLEQIKNVNLKTLTRTLWVADSGELRSELKGLLRLPNMQYLKVYDNTRVWSKVGSISDKNTITRIYEMNYVYRGKNYRIGNLEVVATLDPIYSHLIHRALFIVLSNGIKTFLVAGFIVYIFQHLITRHLIRIAEFAANYNMPGSKNTLKLDRKEKPGQAPDELGILVRAINKMHANLSQYIEALRENQNQLIHQQSHLEELVEERTSSLEAAQEILVRNERLAALGQLTATVSHELRNPLNAMHPSLYIIRNHIDPNDTNVLESLDRLERNLKRCDRIIDELLDFTRITSLALEDVELDVWLRNIIGEMDLDPVIKIEWNLNLTGRILNIDADRLRRAITNVVVNACQAMLSSENQGARESRRILTIETRTAGNRLLINIGDTGSGISRENLKNVFEPLFSTKNFGVGLGMPIVRQIMELHQGGIEIESEEGKGTAVTLWLPNSQ